MIKHLEMILEKLSNIEKETEKRIDKAYLRMASIRSLKELLNQVDFSTEFIPMEDPEKLKELLVSLKGKKLSKNERLLVGEMLGKV